MAPTYEIDGKLVVEAAKQYAGTPFQNIGTAWKATQNAHLSPFAFGAVGTLVVGGDYENSRRHWEDELKNGVDKWIATVDGLNTVAKTHHAAELASTPNATSIKDDTGSASTGNPQVYGEGAVLAITWGLLFENLAVGAVLATASALAPAAVIASIAWAAFSPMDSELNHASSEWGSVARSLNAFPDSLVPGDNILNNGWPAGQASRTAFDNYIYQYKQEVKDALSAATANKGALDKLNTDLTTIQRAFLIEALGILAVMLTSEMLSLVPIIGPVFEALLQVLGAGMAGVATETVAVIAAAIAFCGKNFFSLSGDVQFAGPAPSTKDHPPSFKQIKITWDRP